MMVYLIFIISLGLAFVLDELSLQSEYNSKLEKFFDKTKIVCIITCILLLIGFIISFINLLNAKPTVKDYSVDSTTYITALKDNSELSGKSYLFSGSINEDQYYYYMKKSEDGGLIQNKIKSEDVTLYESNTEIPRIERLVKIESYKGNIYFKDFQIKSFKYKVYLPKNSITREYNVDLEK